MMNITSSLLAFVVLQAISFAHADYWSDCENSAKTKCLIELNYDQFSTCALGGKALAAATDVDVTGLTSTGNAQANSLPSF